jgi:putative tricarboxylic transport membrane protein
MVEERGEMDKRRRKFSVGFDHLVAIGAIPLAIFLIVEAYRAPRPNVRQTLGPEFLPIAVLCLIVVCAVFIFIDATRTVKESQPSPETPAAQPTSPRGHKKQVILVLIVAGLVVYGAILDRAGFIISTTLLVLWSARLFEKGKWVRNVIVSLVFSCSVYYCFVYLLGVSLPAGILKW